MAGDLAAAFPSSATVLEEIEEASGLPLRRAMAEGPAAALAETEVTQVALFAHAAVLLDILTKEHEGIARVLRGVGEGSCGGVVLAGHSVGEFAALHAAGRLSLEEAARLLRLRGASMAAAGQAAEAMEPVKMVACLPTSAENAAIATKEAAAAGAPGLVVELSSVNSRQQVVLAGHSSGVDGAVERLRAAGHCRRAMPLSVSAPFHTSLMSPAAEALAAALGVPDTDQPALCRRSPGAPANSSPGPASQERTLDTHGPVLVHCHDGSVSAPGVAWEALRANLVTQVVQPVRWDLVTASVADQIDGMDSSDEAPGAQLLLELGPGSTLCGLGRANKAPSAARYVPLGTAEQLQAFLSESGGR